MSRKSGNLDSKLSIRVSKCGTSKRFPIRNWQSAIRNSLFVTPARIPARTTVHEPLIVRSGGERATYSPANPELVEGSGILKTSATRWKALLPVGRQAWEVLGLRGHLSFVTPARIERATYSLEGCCSIQLSYGAKLLSSDPDSKRRDAQNGSHSQRTFVGHFGN